MKHFKSQYSIDFEQPIWENDPELFIMDQILEKNIKIILLAAPCFPKSHNEIQAKVGRDGMTLEQVVRAAIYQQHKRLTFRELSNATEDSKKGRSFMKMEYNQYFTFQTLQENISKINSEHLEKIFTAITQFAIDLGVDDGKKLRTDSTAIETNIHHPTNASLLWDCIRVSSRLLTQAYELLKLKPFRDYQKFGKKLFFKIVNTKGDDKRRPLFKKMLQIQRRCQRLVESAIKQLSSQTFDDTKLEKQRQQLHEDLTSLLPMMKKVLDVAHRREILNQEVPVQDKIFSIFEDHTDCIKKGGREVIFGHKTNITSGKSNLIFDCIQELGNPSDPSYLPKTLENINIKFNITPRDLAGDGGYASQQNIDEALSRGVENVVFNKVKGIMKNVTSSKKMETMLKKWRAGIEAIISNLKRGLNLSMCPWRSWDSFKSYVLWSLITFNMRVIAKWVIEKFA
jgi:IS5 family transposase